jgi:RNase P subunit RPR2
MTLFYRLFNTHFELVTENEMDSFIFTEEHLNQKYYAKDFEQENDETFCSKCDSTILVKKEDREITELFGNSVLDIETKVTCYHCGHFNHSHVRFKRGYVMSKKDGKWMCLFPKYPLIIEWFHKFKNIFV